MRNQRLSIVVSPELRRLIDTGAQADGRSTSSYARRVLEEWAAREAVRVDAVEQRASAA
jgi:hypothetical protein